MSVRILVGDCLESLRGMEAESVQCCVTSPPYFGLRDYGHEGQLGLEATPTLYVEKMVEVFREARRVLRNDGTLWLNIGDSYAGSGKGGNREAGSKQSTNRGSQSVGVLYGKVGETARQAAVTNVTRKTHEIGCKAKDLIGIPWMLAFALRADGWYLRSDIIWHKPNPMPESVTDRPTKSHEYVFLLSKSERYFYDAEAIAEPVTESTVERLTQPNLENQAGSNRVPGKTNGPMRAVGNVYAARAFGSQPQSAPRGPKSDFGPGTAGKRNARSVWSITTQPYSGAHFATMPPELAERCIKAGSKECDTVLDPFGGAGTTGLVADRLNRNAILCELNPDHAKLARDRIHSDNPMFANVELDGAA